MAPIPAICDSCGALFVSHNAIEGTGTVVMGGTRVGPCPVCGARWGSIIDGTYELVENVTRYLGGPDVGADSLRRLQALLEQVRDGKAEPERVAEQIRHEIPEASGVAWLLSAKGSTLATWLALVIALITLLLVKFDDAERAPLTTEQIEQIVQDVEGHDPKAVSTTESGPAVSTKVARNEPCPCGSGEKYKRCHGRG
jgi:hypothetical protein